MRRAMRGMLPGEVLRRKKTSLSVSPDFRRLQISGFPRISPTADLLRYVNPEKIQPPTSPLELRMALRPLGLDYWLRGLEQH